MDFHGLKRKELQALCKKHKIPANLSSHEMANRLTELLKEENEPIAKCQDENATVEKVDVVVNKKVKKVRFSPEHELIEFSRTITLKRRSKRNSACISSTSVSEETLSTGEMNSELVGRQGRATRSRGQKPMEDKNNEKERGRRGIKCDKDDEISVEILDNSELGESDINGSRRVTRLRGKVVVEGGKTEIKRERKRAKNDCESDWKALCNGVEDKLTEQVVDNPCRVTRSRAQRVMEDATKEESDINGSRRVTRLRGKVVVEGGKTEIKRERKRAKNDCESDRKALCNGVEDKLTEQVVDNPCRVTRSKAQKVMEDATKEQRGGNVVEDNGSADTISAGNDDGKGVVNGNVERVISKGKVEEELLENLKTAEVDVTIEPPKMLRRSKRNADADNLGDSAKVNDAAKKTKNGGSKGGKEAPQLTADAPGIDAADAADKIDLDRSLDVIVEVEEPIQLNRTISRRKTKGAEHAEQQMENLVVQNNVRRSTRNTSKHKSSETECELGGNGNIQPKNVGRKPHAEQQMESLVVQNNVRGSTRNTSKHKSSETEFELGGNGNIQPKNVGKKRKKSNVSEDVIANNVPNKQVTKKERGRKKTALSDADAVEVADAKELPSVLEQTCEMNTALPEEGLKGAEHSSFVDVQLPVPEIEETANDPGFTSSTSTKKISNDVQLASNGKSLSKEKDVIVADGFRSADPDAEVINKDEAEQTLSKLNSDVLVSTELCVVITDNIDPEPQVVSQPNGISSNIITNGEVVPEGSDVPGNLCSAETRSLDSILPSDQADFMSDHEEKLAEPVLVVFDDDVHDVHNNSILENQESEEHVINMRGSSVDSQQNKANDLESSSNCHGSNNNDTFVKAGETLVSESSDKHSCSVKSKSTLQLKESLASTLRIVQEDGNTVDENGTDGGGWLKDSGASGEGNVLCVSDLFEVEYSKMNFEEKGMQDDSLPGSPMAICANSSIEVNIDRHSRDDIGKSCEIEPTVDHIGKIDEGKSVEHHKSYCSDEDGKYLSNLFDSERRASISLQHGGAFSAEYEHSVSSSPEIIPSKSEDASESLDTGAGVGDMAQGGTNAIFQINIPKEMSTTNAIIQGECDVTNQVDEQYNENTYESEHLNSLLVNPVPDPVQVNKACSALDNDAKNENLNLAMENPVDACPTDVKISTSPSTMGHEKTEETECEDLLTNHTLLNAGEETNNTVYSQSWTEIDLSSLFGKFEDDVTMTRTLSVKGSTVSSRGSLPRKDKEMEGEQESESVKTTSLGMEDQLKLLFETPVNENVTFTSDKELDKNVVSLKEGPETMIENLVSQLMFDEVTGGSTQENLCLENPPEYESAKVPAEVECKIGASEGLLMNNLELVGTCTAEAPSEGEYEVCEASKSQLSGYLSKCEEENANIAKVFSVNEYGIYELSWEQQNENTCTTKVADAIGYEVCEEQLAENASNYGEEIVLTTEDQLEVEHNNAHEVFEEQLAVNTHDCKEEIIITPEGSPEVEYNAHEVDAQKLSENPCSCMGEVSFTADSPLEFEHSPDKVSAEQQAENTIECKEALMLCDAKNTDLVNDCAPEVPQEGFKEQLIENENVDLVTNCTSQVALVEGTKEQFVNTNEFKDETEWNKPLTTELASVYVTNVASGATSYVCEAPEQQLTENEIEREERTQLNEMKDSDVSNAFVTIVIPEAEYNNAHEAFGEQLVDNTPASRNDETLTVIGNPEEKHSDEKELCPDGMQMEEASSSAVSTVALPVTDGDVSMDEKDSMDKGSTLSSTLSNASDDNKFMDAIGKQIPCFLSNLAMCCLLQSDNRNANLCKPEQGMDFIHCKADQQTDVEEVKESSILTIAQHDIPELQSEAGNEELNNNNPSITEYIDVLQESDLADTIKEYTDTESSLAAKADDSDAPTLPKSALPSGMGSVTAPKSPAHIINPTEEGSAVKTKQRVFSTAKKNARTILIHGTPRKPLRGVELKESVTATGKGVGSNIGDLTTVRPKRKAQQDVRWKY